MASNSLPAPAGAESKGDIMKTISIQFIEERRNQPHQSRWYRREIDHIDTYFILANGRKCFLQGIATGAPDYEKTELEDLKKQLLNNDAKYICYHAINEDPIRFLVWIQQKDYHFENFTEFKKTQQQDIWDFSGNLQEYSAAFAYRFWDKKLAQKVQRFFNKLHKTPQSCKA